MVDTRNSSGGSRAETKVQATEPVEADTIHLYPIQQLCKAVVRLRRTFPESEISDDDAKRVLYCCNLDVKKAVAIIKSRVPIVVEDEVSGAPSGGAMASVKRDGNALKRKAADFSTPLNEMVHIHVRKDPSSKQTFTIHKARLCDASPYFESAFNRESLFVDSKALDLDIDFTTPTIFGLFQNWVYLKIITDCNKKLPPIPHMVSLWVLAGALQAPILQNVVIRGLFGKPFCVVPQGFRFLYGRTTPGSALRRLFIDGVMVRGLSTQALGKLLEDHWDAIPEDMKRDLIIAQKVAFQAANFANPLPLLKIQDYLVPDQSQQEA